MLPSSEETMITCAKVMAMRMERSRWISETGGDELLELSGEPVGFS